MKYLVRQISRGLWKSGPQMNSDDIRADAFGCLRTSNDTLSVWQCNSSEGDISEVVLAIASTMDPIEGMFVVLIKESDLNSDDIAFEPTPEETETPIEELRERHFNLINLTTKQLCCLARHIATNVRQNRDVKKFTQRRILACVYKAVEDNRLNPNQLNDSRASLKATNKLRNKPIN